MSILERKKERKKQINKGRKNNMTKVEKMLVIGTAGICTGVWITLGYLVYLNGF